MKQYPPHKSLFKLPAVYIAIFAYLFPLAYILVSAFFYLPPLIGYLMIFIPFIIYFLAKDSEFVRFHAAQSVILNVILPILFELMILLVTISGLGDNQIIGTICSIIYLAVILAIILLSVYAIFKASHYYTTNYPILSKIAMYFAED